MRLIRLVLLGLVVVGAVALPASPVAAHGVIVASTPEEGEILTELPAEFSVTANETLLDLDGTGAFALRIRDADGRYYGDGCVRVVDDTMSATAALGSAGDYVMLWQIVSADGHAVSGEIAFTWEPEAEVAPSEGAGDPPRCGEDIDPGTGATPNGPGDGADAGLVLGIGGAVVVGGLLIWLIGRAIRRRP